MSLIGHTIRLALETGCFDRVIVSTDDQAISEIARRFGAEAPRLGPAALATDEAPVIDAVLHALERLERDDRYVPDGVALLQPTSPLRSVDTIRRGIELFRAMAVRA